MKICIIGCGYLGKAAAQLWKAQGHEITVTTRSLERAYQLRAIADLVYVLDENWEDLLEKQDLVLLSIAPDAQSNYIDTYIKSAETLVRGVKNSAVSQIIYTSSTSIYGDHQGNWVDEQTSLRPPHLQAQILLQAEQIILQASQDKRKVCVFRLGEIFGPQRSIVERVSRMRHHSFAGTGAHLTNIIHLDDILSALNIALEQSLQGIYNLCNDLHIPRKELYHQICQAHGWPQVTWDPSRTNPHSGNKKVSNEKLKSCGWTPSINHAS